MMRIVHPIIIALLLLPCYEAKAQYLPEHISNEALYSFLDELANEHIITLATVVKPYSWSVIASKLDEASRNRMNLTERQQYMLDMYRETIYISNSRPLRSTFGPSAGELNLFPPSYSIEDGSIRAMVSPILGVHHHTNQNGDITHLRGGLAVSAYSDYGWSFWGNMRKIYQTNEVLALPDYLTHNEGGLWAHEQVDPAENNHQYNEIRGGAAFSWGWGNVAIQKEHLLWGDHYHTSNILSIRPNTPSYPMISLQVALDERLILSYQHGWLNSMVIDSLRVFEVENHPERYDYYNKFFAANMLTIMPVERLHLSIGNSIIYSSNNMYIGNFIPFMVFRALEPTQAESRAVLNNPAVFINISSRQIRYLHLYGSWFANSFMPQRLFDSDRLNYTSTKFGARLSNWPLPNTSFTAEYTFTYPKTFLHRTPMITYEHKRFNMGHHMGPNATDLYAAINVQPWRGLQLSLTYNDAWKGNIRPHEYGGAQDREPFMERVVWRSTSYTLNVSYQLDYNIGIYARARFMHVKGFDADGQTAQYYLDRFSPAFHHGETTTISAGFYINR